MPLSLGTKEKLQVTRTNENTEDELTHELRQITKNTIGYNMLISRVTIVSTKVLESSVKRCKLVFLPRSCRVFTREVYYGYCSPKLPN